MFSLFILYFSMILCCIYVYIHILNIKTNKSFFYTQTLIISLFISIIITASTKCNSTFRLTFMLLFCYFYLTIYLRNGFYISFITFLISFGVNLIFYTISNFLLCIFFITIYKTAKAIPYSLVALPTSILQFIFIFYFLRSKRIQKGIILLIRKKKVHLGIFISLLFLLCIILTNESKNLFPAYIRNLSNCFYIILSIFLLYWWRHRIKQTYIENLRRLENLTYENTIADKDKQIKELEANNAYLAQIIHKYRKVIPAMELSVMELLQNNANLDTNTLKSNAQALQVQLEELRAERNNLLDNYQKDMVVTPQSGLHTIDAMIALMEKQAKEQWVRYKTQIDPSIKELALASVKEADLLHLLGDLIENALHAVNESDHKEILIHISKLNGCLLLEVSDSGAVFDIETYQHFGNEPFTSHEADGGSGTGLMEIWKLKKEYKISLYIYEYETDSNVYTKKISFLFDKKNHFLLKTYRDKEVKNALIRGDLHVFPHKND